MGKIDDATKKKLLDASKNEIEIIAKKLHCRGEEHNR